ncbi:hypothetical protein ACFW91_06430 [Streptomyces asoensis]|uniref:hypothetical protein n=1 Tax=Streptomyces asoensis TaxID=249586 RepID=UPI0036BBCAAC
MRLRKRATAAVFMSTAISLAPHAMAAPMPWETSRTPTTMTQHVPSTAAGDIGAVTVLCAPPCYQ